MGQNRKKEVLDFVEFVKAKKEENLKISWIQ